MLTVTPNPLLRPADAPADPTGENFAVTVPEDLRHVRKIAKRNAEEQLRIVNAARHLQAIPQPGESLHLICKGNFAAWDFVPAVLRLVAPATIRRLDIVTLGFSKNNVAELAELIDAKAVGEVGFVFSCYFISTSKVESGFLFETLPQRGVKIAAVRSHSKLLLMETTADQHVVIETSANLRSCRNIEQFTICDDAGLLAFHRAWIDGVIRDYAAAAK
jgi:hypothetical protein